MCDKKFSIKGNLDRHHKRVHEHRNKTLKCDQCDNYFYDQGYLNQHKLNVHSTDELKCEFCKKTYNSALYLKI